MCTAITSDIKAKPLECRKNNIIFFCTLELMLNVPFDPKLIIMSAMPVCSFLKIRGVTSDQTFSALRIALSTSAFFRSGV